MGREWRSGGRCFEWLGLDSLMMCSFWRVMI